MKKDLQKLTESKKVNELIKKSKLNANDLDGLTMDEKDEFGKWVMEKLNTLKGYDLDDIIEQVEAVLPEDSKNQLWESNHWKITQTISNLIEEYGKMPGKSQIAEACGLSRQTIHKHLMNYDKHSLYAEHQRKFKFMADRVISKMFRKAVEGGGDTKAARLYLEALGYLGNGSTNIKNQTNYIQINGRVLSQEIVQQLTPGQLQQIESIVQEVQTIPIEQKKA
jgi:DNA-binding phage protein